MSTISLTVDQMRHLLIHARTVGTTYSWEEMAMEWMEAAEKEIQRLKELLKEKENG